MMVTMKTPNRWLGLLGAAVILSSAGVLAYSSIHCDDDWLGDGDCDQGNNNEECGYDSGDCCACTCEDTADYTCGDDVHGGFACIDPNAECVDDDSVTVDLVENCGYLQGIGDGYCDHDNNKEECAYDGGDCCSCSCETTGDDDYSCTEFACIDPNAECVDDDDVTADMVENCGFGIGDGYCDSDNNNAGRAYDGGDCCSCTCETADNGWLDDYSCREFACIDPNATCVDDDDITIDMAENCTYLQGIGNGNCDSGNNKEECAYDGGDCCSCTCETTGDDGYSCTEFTCIDPNAECVDDDDVTADMVENCGYVNSIGNGYCDQDNNKEECDYDGGDCCFCTCENQWDDDWACSTDYGFDCKDRSAPCYGEENNTLPTDHDDDDDEEPLPTVDGAVEVGTKTEVGVSATAYDARPGASSGEAGCGEAGGDGCAPANSRDGVVSEIESRWSCAMKLVDDEGPCQIEYTFGEPQDIVDIQVAFWKGNERIRTLDVHLDGLRTHTHESYVGSTFNTLGVEAAGVSKVMLEPVGLLSDEWISLIEVLIFVTP